MKRFLTSGFMLLAIVLTGCGYSEPDQLEHVSEETESEVSAFVTNYKEEMIRAMNGNDTDTLESDYLIPNTSFYHALHRYREDLQKNGSSKELVSFDVEDVWYDSDEGDYYADAIEHVLIHTGDETEDITRHVRFRVVEGSDDTFRLFAIIDRTDLQ